MHACRPHARCMHAARTPDARMPVHAMHAPCGATALLAWQVIEYVKASPFGQQAALFTQSAERAAPLVDALSTAVGRVNLNTQCGRSPDELPFSGRRSSALGTMSVAEALRAFSIETVVAGKHAQPPNPRLASELRANSAFMKPLQDSPYRDEI